MPHLAAFSSKLGLPGWGERERDNRANPFVLPEAITLLYNPLIPLIPSHSAVSLAVRHIGILSPGKSCRRTVCVCVCVRIRSSMCVCVRLSCLLLISEGCLWPCSQADLTRTLKKLWQMDKQTVSVQNEQYIQKINTPALPLCFWCFQLKCCMTMLHSAPTSSLLPLFSSRACTVEGVETKGRMCESIPWSIKHILHADFFFFWQKWREEFGRR